MSMFRHLAIVGIATLAAVAGGEAVAQNGGYPQQYGFGTTPSPEELAKFFAVAPDGTGLPPGEGSYGEGQKIFAESCAACPARSSRVSCSRNTRATS